MRTKRIAVLLGATLIMAACGASLPPATETTAAPNTTEPAPITTTVPAATSTTATPTTTQPVPVDSTVPTATSTTAASTTTTNPPTTTTTTPPPDGVEVLVFLVGGPGTNPDNFDCSQVAPVTRIVEPPTTLAGAMKALLAGPTAEEIEEGFSSWFHEDAGWELESATISDRIAYIDFSEDSPLINNASTSCGSGSFIGQLVMTATQFPSVDHALFSFGGDAEAFYGWLQRGVPDF